MQVKTTALDGVLIFTPKCFADERGFFRELYHKDRYEAAGGLPPFVQDNHSRSARGVLRGLHFQEPMAQGKLVQVVRGGIFDVAVDIRWQSADFGRWVGVELTQENSRQLWIPPGFAHGFLSLADDTDVIYKCSEYYAPHHENTLLWNDPDVAIAWPMLDQGPFLSPKDAAGQTLNQISARSGAG
jgi:dTDP-4-dehydrorhamnose 3,5-epimerase